MRISAQKGAAIVEDLRFWMDTLGYDWWHLVVAVALAGVILAGMDVRHRNRRRQDRD